MNNLGQKEINAHVENAYSLMLKSIIGKDSKGLEWKPFRWCKAELTESGEWLILRSYIIMVAAYNYRTNEIFDFLRMVYGYSATSAQHIAKFVKYVTENNAYGEQVNFYRWRQI